MEDIKNQKEKLIKVIEELRESINSDMAKKINLKQLERVSNRLIQFYDECSECQEYTEQIINHIEDFKKLNDFYNKQELINYKRSIKTVVAHLHKKHKLIVEGNFMSTYMSIGLAVGAGLGTIFNSISIGVSVGLCIGIAVGIGVDGYYKKKDLVL